MQDVADLAEKVGAVDYFTESVEDKRGKGQLIVLTFNRADPPAEAKLVFYENGDVFWTKLRSETDDRIGLYDNLAKRTPKWFKKRGAKRFVAEPASSEAAAVLRKRLNWEGDDSRLVTRL